MYHTNLSLIVELYETVPAGNVYRISNQVVTWFFPIKIVIPLSANPTKWSNTLKKFVLSVFDYFVGLTLKGSIRNPF